MRLISYDGVSISSLQVEAHVGPDLALPGENRTADFQPRRGASPLMTGAIDSGRPIPVLFTSDHSDDAVRQARMRKLLSRLNVRSDEPRTLIAELDIDDDDDGIIDGVATVSIEAITGPWTWWDEAPGIELTFYAVDALWTETSTSTQTLLLDAATPSDTVTNNGAVTVSPTITIDNYQGYIIAQRDRLRLTFTNDAELPIERDTVVLPVPYSIGLGSAVALLKDGTFYPVSSLNPSGASEIWCAFPITVDPGESETYDLIGQVNTEGDLDTYTRFDGNYCALDLGMEGHSVASYAAGVITVSGSPNWPANRWAGASMYVYAGTGSGQKRELSGNGTGTLTPRRTLSTGLDATSKIVLIGAGWYMDGGTITSSGISSITDSAQAWVPGSLEGATLTIGVNVTTVIDNTATQLTFSPTISPAPTGTYTLDRPGYHRYYVDQVKHSEDHRGGWQINKRFTQPSKTLWGDDILNGWGPSLLFENGDDYNQLNWTEVNLGGSDDDYWPMLNASRWRGSDKRRQQHKQFDGVSVYHPLGYDAIRFDYQHKNTNGIAKFLFAGREAGGDEMESFVEDSTTRATLTPVAAQNVDLRTYGSPEELYMGIQPANGVEVSRDALETDEANVRWYQTLRLWLDIRDRYAYSIGSVETVIAVEDEIRIGDYALQIGQRDGQRLYIKSTESLVLDCANARAWIDDGAGTETDVTYAVTPVVYDQYGTTKIADKWPVLAPGANTVTATTDVWSLSGGYELTFDWREAHLG